MILKNIKNKKIAVWTLEYWAFCKQEAGIWAFSKYTLLFLFLFQDVHPPNTQDSKFLLFY